MAKMIGIGRHRLDHLLGQRALGGQAEENIGAVQRLGERPLVGGDRVGGLPLVHAFDAAAIDNALGVAQA